MSATTITTTAQPRLPRSPSRRLRVGALSLKVCLIFGLALLLTVPASALDEIVLKNGRRYLGTILVSTPDTIVVAIDGGTVEFPRAIVASPPFLGPIGVQPDRPVNEPAAKAAPAEVVVPHPLPGVADALHRLRSFAWVTEIRQVPVLVTDQGRWQFLPCVSFWAGDFFQVNFFGDSARPSAVEVSLHHPPPNAWEQKRHLLEYMLSLAPGLAADNRFDGLDVKGDQFAIGDLWFEVTGPDNPKTPGRWTVLLLHETSLQASRATYDDLKNISELILTATIDPTKPRSWQHASWTPTELAWIRQTPGNPAGVEPAAADVAGNTAFTGLGGERVFVRAYVRERGRYARSANDWTREFLAGGP